MPINTASKLLPLAKDSSQLSDPPGAPRKQWRGGGGRAGSPEEQAGSPGVSTGPWDAEHVGQKVQDQGVACTKAASCPPHVGPGVCLPLQPHHCLHPGNWKLEAVL